MMDIILIMDLISIHTPTRGVTGNFKQAGYTAEISIHTPTRGVTERPHFISDYLQYFNPHSHKGSDLYANTTIYTD